MKILPLDSLTGHHLLERYLFAEDFLRLDLDDEAARLRALARGQHAPETLRELQSRARQTIGVTLSEEQQRPQRLSAQAWLRLIETLKAEIAEIQDGSTELIGLSKQTPYHAPLTSLKGSSELLAALLLAELRDPAPITHIKQIERLAGLNLYVHDAGRYKGRRRISHMGTARLRWVLYRMASETSKYVPEIRCKYLRRRLAGQTNRPKNLGAVIPPLLRLVMTLIREEPPYEQRPDTLAAMRRLEAKLAEKKPAKRPRPQRRRQEVRA